MATINFYLKEPNKEKSCLILLVYQEKGQKFKYSTGLKVTRQNWNGRRIKGKTLEIINDNIELERLEAIFTTIEKEAAELQIQYSFEAIEKKFRAAAKKEIPVIEIIEPTIETETSDFFKLYDLFILENRNTKCESTIKAYKGTKTILSEFEKAKSLKITLEMVNQRFYEKFLNYLIEEEKLLNNSIGKHIKTIKTFINYIINNELTSCKINLKGFKVLKEDIDIVSLKDTELMRMYSLDGLTPELELVKDYFCFESFTGIRFSDVCKMQKDNLKGDFLEFRTQKTKDALLVPLNVFAKEILEKYKGTSEDRLLPATLCNAQFNYAIKDIAEIAGLNEVIIVEKFSGANRLVIKKPKCDIISTHTGRRTFITLSYEKGMQPEMIMKITGIKSWNTLKKYMKVSEQMKLIKMNEFWNRDSLKVV